MASAAFGPRGFLFTKWLVTAMCFFGAVAYAVLLRDVLMPITDAIWQHHNSADVNATLLEDYYYEAQLQTDAESNQGPSFQNNLTML